MAANTTKRRFGKEVRPCCLVCGRRLQAIVVGGERIGLGYDAEGYFHSKACAAQYGLQMARWIDSRGKLDRIFD